MSTEPEAPKVALGWKKSLLYSLIPVVILFCILEIAARVVETWVPPRQVDLGQGFTPDIPLFVPSPDHPEMMITNPAREASFNKQTFPKKKPAGSLRIFALGGSSIKYMDYEFPEMAKRLAPQVAPKYSQVQIVNCGALSYGSHRIVPIAAEVLNYEPDVITLYCAHNEFEEIEQLRIANLKTLPLQRLLSKSALCRFIRDRIATFEISQLQQDYNKRLLANSIPDSSKAWGHNFTPEELAERMIKYRNNLSVIIQMCQDRHVPIIIGSVPSNLIKPSLAGEPGRRYQDVLDLFAKGDYDKGQALARDILRHSPRHQSSDEENGIIRSLARQYGAPLADVEAFVIAKEPHHVPGETLFNDHCHLNPEGNKLLAAAYEEQIVSLFQ